MIGIALASVLALAACGGSDGAESTANGPAVSLGTVPDGDDTANTDPAATPVETSTESAGTVGGSTPSESSTTLVASPDADLPTAASQEDTTPTTVAGPLPTPAVTLVEVGAFDRPVEATSNDVDGRLFVVGRGGTITAIDDLSNDVVFDIDQVPGTSFTDEGSEQGLLGLAFHPDLDLAYVNYTDRNGDTVVAEFGFDPVTSRFDPASFRRVLSIEQPFSNHNGGELAFGPDGLLYIGTGDGGSADDPNRTALDVSSPLGKILRIDPVETDDQPYTVPFDNPFVRIDGAEPAVWSLGLRNPWKFSFDSLLGDLWIGDVGQNRLEEIDLAPAVGGSGAGRGISFGWSAYEADDRFNEDQPADGHVFPVASYVHEDGNCSISGGAVARESSVDALNGWYVYGDFCSGRLWALDTTSVASTPDGPEGDPVIVELGTVPGLSAVVEGPFGDLYALSIGGPVFRLAPA